MKKRILSILLCLCMAAVLMPTTALAWTRPDNIKVNNATYHSTGALKEITASFYWHTASANSRLVLMTERLRSAGEDGTNPTWGDFTDLGFYGSMFSSFENACAYDQDEDGGTAGVFGIVSYTDASSVQMNSNNTMTMSFTEDMIPLNTNKIYYIYLWTQYWNNNYPDTLICAIQVQDGAVKYAAATDRNSYDDTFGNIESRTAYDVTVIPAGNMTKDSESGDATQSSLTAAMTPVIYTADENYYFPEEYSVETVNGIMVRRDSQSQITVYGTPSDDAEITLAEPVAVTTYAVTFDKNGISSATDTSFQTVAEGEKVTEPDAPTAEGYTFEGWYKEAECTNPWVFDTDIVNGATTIYAKWVKNTSTSSLENTVFNFAYDVQRNPAFPTKNQQLILSGLYYPILGTGSHGTTNDGSWTLTKSGTYSYMKSIGKNTSNLDAIITRIVSEYSDSLNREEVVIHELKDDADHIAYGVVVAYDATNGYAVFLGDTLGDGAGYLLSTEARSGSVTATAGTIATDFVQNLNISLSETGTYTFDEATVGYDEQTAKEITVTNTGNDDTGDLTVTLSGVNADSFTLSKDTIDSITDTGSTDTFTVKPNIGLNAGTYTAIVTVSGENIVSKSFDVSFTVNAVTYTVTWKSQDGSTELEKDTDVASDTVPGFDGSAPTKAADDHYTYTFAGWTTEINQESGTAIKDLPKVTADVTYYAAFSKTARSYNVTLNSNGAKSCDELISYTYGTGATLPTPIKTGYTFVGWYDNEELTGTAVTGIVADAVGDKTYYAKWKKKSSGGSSSVKTAPTPKPTVTPAPAETPLPAETDTPIETLAPVETDVPTQTAIPDANPFIDITENDWFCQPVLQAFENGLVFGLSDTEFAPEMDITRAMFVTILYRVENEPDMSNEISGYLFEDVNLESWYSDAVYWARHNGLVEGYSDEEFAPEQNIIREQMAAIVYRYAKFKGYNTEVNGTLNYADNADISDYAKDAVIWNSDNGIMFGNDDNTFAPKDNTTRAQAAAVFERIVENMN